jgi:hypothetical protein
MTNETRSAKPLLLKDVVNLLHYSQRPLNTRGNYLSFLVPIRSSGCEIYAPAGIGSGTLGNHPQAFSSS